MSGHCLSCNGFIRLAAPVRVKYRLGLDCSQHRQFLGQGLMPIIKSDVWDVRLVDVIAGRPRHIPLLPYPMTLYLHLESTLYHGVTSQLGEGALRELVDVSSHAILFK